MTETSALPQDLTTATPVEIDTALAENYYAANSAANRKGQALDHLRYSMPRSERKSASRAELVEAAEAQMEAQPWNARSIQSTLDRLTDAEATLARLREEAEPLNAEYQRRPWTRAFLVTDGHVHSSMGCSTCNNGEYATSFTWLTEYSGKDEAEVIEAAKSRACTVCYPDAPVETAGESALMTPDERTRAEKRADAAKAKAARLAKKIEKGLTEDGSEFKVEWLDRNAGGHERDPETGASTYVYRDRPRREFFKTEQAATQWVVQYLVWDGGWDGEKADGFTQVVEAVARKHGKSVEDVKAELDAKAEAKRKRDNR